MNLKELSELLGLSQTTVSRALNGYPEVREKTRQRVMQAAAEHNYSPSTRARGLATGRAMQIGHVIPVSTSHEMVNPVFGDFIAGAGETYAAEGYEMTISLVPDETEESAYRALHGRQSVDGIVVHGPRMNDQRIDLLTELGLPFVVHGRATHVETPYSWLDVNNQRAFERATGFLLELGHRKVALINGLEQMDFAHRRRNGYLAALAARGLTARPEHMVSGEMTEILGYASAREMLAQNDPPTAFMVSSMICAIGVRRALSDAGLTMGRDVSVITFDDDLSYLRNGEDVPIFTATRSSVREAGRRLARILIDRIKAPDSDHVKALMEAELIIGNSTGPVPN